LRNRAYYKSAFFTTLHKNVKHLDFNLLLPDIVTIADEVDAQLRQQMHCYKAANVAKMAKANRKSAPHFPGHDTSSINLPRCIKPHSTIHRSVPCFPYVESIWSLDEGNCGINAGDEQAAHCGIGRAHRICLQSMRLSVPRVPAT